MDRRAKVELGRGLGVAGVTSRRRGAMIGGMCASFYEGDDESAQAKKGKTSVGESWCSGCRGETRIEDEGGRGEEARAPAPLQL